MQIKLLALFLLLLSSGLVGCRSAKSPGATDDKSPVIVEINGVIERQTAFERFVKARLSDLGGQGTQTPSDNDQLRSSLFDKFVLRQLVAQEAAKKKIEPTDDEIRVALETQHKQTSGEAANQGLATLESSERRIEIFSELLTLKFYKTEVLKDVKVTPEEIGTYYAKNRDQYQDKNGFYVREIRVSQDTEAQKLYRQALAKPADFAVLAKEHSEAPTANNGGLIYYEAQQLPPVLEQAITPLKVGSISRVVKSNYGFHIFKLEQRAEPLPLDKAKQEIEGKLLSEKNQSLIEGFNQQTISGAKIVIHRDKLGFNYVGKLGS